MVRVMTVLGTEALREAWVTATAMQMAAAVAEEMIALLGAADLGIASELGMVSKVAEWEMGTRVGVALPVAALTKRASVVVVEAATVMAAWAVVAVAAVVRAAMVRALEGKEWVAAEDAGKAVAVGWALERVAVVMVLLMVAEWVADVAAVLEAMAVAIRVAADVVMAEVAEVAAAEAED
jgi:hypothetical protein